MKEEEQYNIKNYTDEEIYKILNLENNVSDKILEAKILGYIKKYENMQTPAGVKLASFFLDIYKYFFDEENEEVLENFETNQEEVSQSDNEDSSNVINDENEDKDVILTKEVKSSKGTINPLIQQTIRRVISIDSQYREDKSKIATDFTFNLSEPLKDVVSLSMYSVQIPYTWYTVNSNFGSNFFFFKGDAPGINNGNFDYKIEITPGNYTADNLVIAINSAFQAATLATNDISFGNTNISYNENNQVTSMEIFIEQNYTETSYYLDFISWSQSYDDDKRRDETIASFLGFQKRINYFDTLTSIRDANGGLRSTNIAGAEDTILDYWIDDISKKFKIIRYLGPGEYTNGVSIENISIEIELDITWDTDLSGTFVSRNTLVSTLNTALLNNPLLSLNSQISRINASEDEIGYNDITAFLKSYFSLKIEFDRAVTENLLSLKTYIEFPEELNVPNGYKKIWTGTTSCFRFKNKNNELNELISDFHITPLTTNKYIVNRNPYIDMICKKQYFDVEENNYRITIENSYNEENIYRFIDNSGNYIYDISVNFEISGGLNLMTYNKDINDNYIDKDGNIIYPMPSMYNQYKDINGYTLNNYVLSLNEELKILNDKTKSGYNLEGDINLNNSYFSITPNSEIGFRIDINKRFTRRDFLIEIPSDSFLIEQLNYNTDSLIDLSENIFKTNSRINASYTIKKNNLLGHLLMVLKPKSTSGAKNMPSIDIIIPFAANQNSRIFFSLSELENILNITINQALDYENDLIMSESTISLKQIDNQNYECEINISIQKILTENDFVIYAIDPGYPDFNTSESLISWRDHLFFIDDILDINKGLSLNNDSFNYSDVVLGSRVLLEVISITNVNNQFKLIPYLNGVQDNNNVNDIIFNIENGEYNRDQLVEKINQELKSNTITNNSKLELLIQSDTNGQLNVYSKFRFEVRKQYTANDYKIIFYDPFSFAACYPGVSSVRTATFDNTLGWTMGFRAYTIYYLRSYEPDENNVYRLSGNTTVSTDLYNYLLITLDDFNQNHLNDGLVTISNKETDIASPAYADKSKYKCDPATGRIIYETANNEGGNKLTQAQLYTISEIANIKANNMGENSENYGDGPYVKDVFGLIPIKTASLRNGNVYVEFGGTLQNQERKYFGPVNINRMAVRLLSDKGDVMNLNGSNWSFSLIAEQLYQS